MWPFKSKQKTPRQQLEDEALARKCLIVQSYSDGLGTRSITQNVYKSFLSSIIMSKNEYNVPSGADILIGPGHTLSGTLKDKSGQLLNGYNCHLMAQGNAPQLVRGILWTGPSTDINMANDMSKNGHPLTFNCPNNVQLIPGDIITFVIDIPDGRAIDWTQSSIIITCNKEVREIG